MSVYFFGPFFDWVIYFSGIELQEMLVYFCHFSVFAWKIPGMEEPSGLPFIGSDRVGDD